MGTGQDHRRGPRAAAGVGVQHLSRLVEVPPERLPRWVEGFAQRHGQVVLSARPDALTLTAQDGATADLEVPWPPLPGNGIDALAAHAAAPRVALLVLVRRGGYAAGLARDGALLEHAVGTRYVQSRTAAGGWSQQRFARRRREQASALVASAVGAVLRVLSEGPPPEVVVPGGDRLLVSQVMADRRLAAAGALPSGLPSGPPLDVPDPRLAVLRDAARRSRMLRVRVSEGAG